MNEGLFEKYSRVIVKKKTEKENLLLVIKEKTNILFLESEVSIQGKDVCISSSSAKKATAIAKGLGKALEDAGYILATVKTR